ncbi:hypothetical protein F2Q69_00006712 [Brassica cretica]|uniref:Uncharacterized protein n=1 Tax=Brassica cretica TaxID=69181 RepID=A0A8S9PGT8_BRACR|nr:hypothetical protein F2Q69_00006712 [Brassica cretica]
MVGSGLFTLLKVECDKIRVAPCEGCLRTLVEGIKHFVVHPGVEILRTCFPREDYKLSSRNLTLGCLILCLEMLEISVLDLGQDLGLITALGGAMITSTYISRIVFDLIPSRFKPLSDGAMVAQILRLGVKNVFTQIAKDIGKRALVVIDRPSFPGLSVLRWPIVIENDSPLLGRRSLRGLIHNQCRVGCGMIAYSDVTEENERQQPASCRAKNEIY